MVAATETFSQWLGQAELPEDRLTAEQRALLHSAFHFRQTQGDDYYATRLLSHFLLNANSGLKVAQIARLLGISRPTASRQRHCSSKQTVQQAHHRMNGRPYGKLLPRYAGPIAQFLLTHPDATRHDTLDFIERTFAVRVSTVALAKFLKKYGLDAATRQAVVPPHAPVTTPAVTATADPPPTEPPAVAAADRRTAPPPPTATAHATLPASLPRPTPALVLPPPLPFIPQGQPLPAAAPPFSSHARSTPAPSC